MLSETQSSQAHEESIEESRHDGEATVVLRLDTTRPFKEVKRELLDALEMAYVQHLLETHGGNISAAERGAGLSRRHLRTLLRKHGLYAQVVESRIAGMLEALP
jgi:DNA-binding NtrC family response regulator